MESDWDGTLVNMVAGEDDFSDEIADDEPDDASPADTLGELKQLGELRDSGVPTEAEFESHKAQILGTAGASSPPAPAPAPTPPVPADAPAPPHGGRTSDVVEVRPGALDSKDLDAFVRALEGPPTRAGQTPRLVGPDGASIELPASIHNVLVSVVDILKAGGGVSIIPLHAELTTVQAG